MRGIRGVLFDLDGTLMNTLEDIADAMNRALRLHALPVWETQAYRYLVGDGAEVLARRAVRDRRELAADVRETYQAWYALHKLEKSRPYPGIPETLLSLQARGLPLMVLSNKPDADTRQVVAHFFPEIDFARVQGQLPGVPVKPNPSSALGIAAELGLPPESIAYLGDTAVDIQCACRAGMHPVGALWGFRKADELRSNGAEALIERPEELPALLDMQMLPQRSQI